MPRPRKMTEEKIAEARKMEAEGMKRKDIAPALGVSLPCLILWMGPKWKNKAQDPVAEPQA